MLCEDSLGPAGSTKHGLFVGRYGLFDRLVNVSKNKMSSYEYLFTSRAVGWGLGFLILFCGVNN